MYKVELNFGDNGPLLKDGDKLVIKRSNGITWEVVHTKFRHRSEFTYNEDGTFKDYVTQTTVSGTAYRKD